MAGAGQNLRPLDIGFVSRLVAVTGRANLNVRPRSENHFWMNTLQDLMEKHTYAEIAEIIAKEYADGKWNDETAPTTSELIRGVFAGYDRTKAASSSLGLAQGGPASAAGPSRQEPEPRQRDEATPAPRTGAAASSFTQRTPARTPAPRGAAATIAATQRAPVRAVDRIRRGTDSMTQTPPETPTGASGSTRAQARTQATSATPGRPETAYPTPLPSTSRSRTRTGADNNLDIHPSVMPPPEEQQSMRPPVDNEDDGSVPEPPRVDLKDMEGTHTFKGQRQPAIGIRIQHAYNWAVDEDIDRRRDFEREKAEIKEWIKFVEREHAHTLGENTLKKMDALKRKLEVHDLFEQEHHRATMKTKISNPTDMKTVKQRLGNPDEGPPLQLGSISREERNAKLMPKQYGTHPRRPHWVNQMWNEPRERALDWVPKLNEVRVDRIQALARHEDAYWQTPPGQEPPADNLSVRENKYYEDCKAFNNGMDGWVHWDQPLNAGESEVRRLWTGDTPGNGEGCFAAERGARRAGLEIALRQFRNAENKIAATKSSLLVALPPTAKELAAERRRAGANRGRLIDIHGVGPHEIQKTQGKDDPQGFMANMAQFWVKQKAVVEQARENLIEENTSMGAAATANCDSPESNTFVKPPHSIWGPMVWRGVNLEEEQKQDLLRQARAVKRVFDRERKIAPRTLLDVMSHFFNQGYTTHTEEPLYPPTGPLARDGGQRRLTLEGPRNRDPTTNNLRRLDMIEMEWIRLILNNAMSDERALEDVQPRTSLFLLFTEKLERLFNDLWSDLFPERDSAVEVEALIEHMASVDGPIKRPRFYPYDVKHWLERLQEQGRCRFQDNWRAFGWVQRPVYKYFPEQLIVWKDRQQGEIDPKLFPEDAVYAPRFSEDLQGWQDIAIQNPPPKLDAAVETWFHQLAFRWGRTMRGLENLEARVWTDNARLLPNEHLHRTLDQLDAEYSALAAPQKLDLATVVRRTLGKPCSEAISEEEALQTIREGIIDECVRSDSMLWPGRAKDYLDTSKSAVKMREGIWDWAKPEVRGPVKQFFSLARWPVEIQPEAIQRKIKDGDDDDPYDWDPIKEDPTPWRYWRPKPRPYRIERVVTKEGPRKFLLGDTPRQQRVIQRRIASQFAQSMGLDDGTNASGGVWGRVKGFFKRKRHDDDDSDDDDLDGLEPAFKLPRIDPSLIPRSVDRAELEAGRNSVAVAAAQPIGDAEALRADMARNPNLRIRVPAAVVEEVDDEEEGQ